MPDSSVFELVWHVIALAHSCLEVLAYRRELYGRGVIGLVKSSHWYQQLQESQQLSLPAIGDAVRVQARTFL